MTLTTNMMWVMGLVFLAGFAALAICFIPEKKVPGQLNHDQIQSLCYKAMGYNKDSRITRIMDKLFTRYSPEFNYKQAFDLLERFKLKAEYSPNLTLWSVTGYKTVGLITVLEKDLRRGIALCVAQLEAAKDENAN